MAISPATTTAPEVSTARSAAVESNCRTQAEQRRSAPAWPSATAKEPEVQVRHAAQVGAFVTALKVPGAQGAHVRGVVVVPGAWTKVPASHVFHGVQVAAPALE